MAATRRFSLRRVRLQHYRSIASCDVLLGPLTVLVGPNGAGKSNFLDSLPFVAQALDENLDNALRERGGVTEVRRRSTGHPTHFVIDLSCEGDDFSARHAFKIAAVRGGDFKVSHESCRMPAPASDRLYLVSASGLAPFRALFDGLAAVRVYSLAPELMRKPQPPDAGDLLRRDGSNVASVLERLRREQPELKSRIEEYLRAIVPGVDSVDRRGLGSYESLEFRQQIAGASGSWTFPATSMSDGTLRALGVLVALYGSSEDIHPPIGIEEPEVALHPAAAGLLFEALSGASERRQVLTTSHSPDLLDTSASHADQVLAVRADGGRTVVNEVDQAAATALKEGLYTVGELLRVDQLHPAPTPTQPDLVPWG